MQVLGVKEKKRVDDEIASPRSGGGSNLRRARPLTMLARRRRQGESCDGCCASRGSAEGFCRHRAARCLVGGAPPPGSDARCLHLVRHLGRVAERQLSLGRVSVAPLFAVDHRRLDPGAAIVADPLTTRTLPRDLLLLPEGLLPIVFPRPVGLRSRRPSRRPLPRRDRLPPRAPEPPSLSLLRHVPLSALSVE